MTEGVLGGYSKIVLEIQGDEVYGHLKFESGAHRVQRVPKTESQGRVHTSAATVAIIPVWEDEEININRADLKIDTFRASGAGGQHVNVTDSAVRITHLPSGIVTSCQNERSQHQNKDRAMQILRAKLAERQREERMAELSNIRGEQRSVGFGSQIRSYVTQPYQMVKDLRSGYEVGNVDGVFDGDLDGFMEAYLQWERSGADTAGE